MANAKVFLWSLVVALGGFLFGFDTAVISGAEKDIQAFWQLNVFEHGLTVSIALIGTVVGALFGGIPSDRLGRKKTLFWIGRAVFRVGGGLGRHHGLVGVPVFPALIGGFGVGASSVTAPLYISEISPARLAGQAGCHVPVQRGVRHPGLVPVQLPAGRHRRQRLAAGCWA
jgi:MFS family permease